MKDKNIDDLLYSNRICWEESEQGIDFEYIGVIAPNTEYELHLYNCIKKGCENYKTTIASGSLEKHYERYHK